MHELCLNSSQKTSQSYKSFQKSGTSTCTIAVLCATSAVVHSTDSKFCATPVQKTTTNHKTPHTVPSTSTVVSVLPLLQWLKSRHQSMLIVLPFLQWHFNSGLSFATSTVAEIQTPLNVLSISCHFYIGTSTGGLCFDTPTANQCSMSCHFYSGANSNNTTNLSKDSAPHSTTNTSDLRSLVAAKKTSDLRSFLGSFWR